MNKQGEIGDQVAFLLFFFILAIISFAIVGGAVSFFGDSYDFRESEASALALNVKSCVLEKGLPENTNDLFSSCGLNKEVIEKNMILRLRSDKMTYAEITGDFEACDFKGAKGAEGYTQCYFTEFNYLGEKIEILAGSNQFTRRSNYG